MHCHVCRDTLGNICNPLKVKRVCSAEWLEAYSRSENVSTLQDDVGKLCSEKSWRDVEELKHWAFGHHTSWQSLQESKDSNCPICERLHCDEKPDFQEVLSFVSVITFSNIMQEDAPYANKDTILMRVFCGFTNYPVYLCATSVSSTLAEIEPSTSSPITFGIIQRWLQDCSEGHECDHKTDRSILPTRLLELTISDTECSFRLVYKHEIAPGERYLTLSHCWGTKAWDEKLVLTEANLSFLRQKQSIEILPQTFKDAFIVLKRLGARYLWIDRFCIQQDSVNDWRVKSASMEKVYSNSYLTIAALGSGNDEGGCFFIRQNFLGRFDTLRVYLRSPRQPITYDTYTVPSILWKSWSSEPVYGKPLLGRAWVLQERFLSPRVLYFGSQQVFWECYELHACEKRPDISLPNLQSYSLGKTLITNQPRSYTVSSLEGPKIAALPPHCPENEIEELFRDWYYVLSDYTGLELTKPDDKLVAISAVAKRLRNIFDSAGIDSEYVAGMWQQRLPYNLLWIQQHSNSHLFLTRLQNNTPSWSWASVGGLCAFFDIRGRTSTAERLVSARFTAHSNRVESKDMFTSDQSVKLILSGSKLIAHMSDKFLPDHALQRLGYVDLGSVRAKNGNMHVFSAIGFDDHRKYPKQKLWGQMFECIPLVLYEYEDEDLPYHLHCMVVKSEGQYYQRIGLARVYLKDKKHVWEAIGSTPREDFELI